MNRAHETWLTQERQLKETGGRTASKRPRKPRELCGRGAVIQFFAGWLCSTLAMFESARYRGTPRALYTMNQGLP